MQNIRSFQPRSAYTPSFNADKPPLLCFLGFRYLAEPLYLCCPEIRKKHLPALDVPNLAVVEPKVKLTRIAKMSLAATPKLLSAPYVLFVRIRDVGHLGPPRLCFVLRKAWGNGKVILYLVLQVGGIFVFGYMTEISQ
jgi:hypothetical protein